MNQFLRQIRNDIAQGANGEAGPEGSDAMRAAVRAELAQAYAAADAILDSIRQENPERFLAQSRQSSGQ